MKGFVIASPSSGSGKTTVSIGLLRALSDRGYAVSPFKAGPDYIDTGYHFKAARRRSHNLDSYMCSPDIVESLFYKYSEGCDIAVVEGVMGLYDGFNCSLEGSSADVSVILDLPVILVVNCKGASVSISALIKGFAEYSDFINIAGVILNNIKSEEHYLSLKERIESDNNIICLGFVKPQYSFSLKSRHLGLLQSGEVDELERMISDFSVEISGTIDVDKLISILPEKSIIEKSGAKSGLVEFPQADIVKSRTVSGNYRTGDKVIAVAMDEAFSFYYDDNLEMLKKSGCSLVYFSPLHDDKLPSGISGLYIGGGYPELYASKLNANVSMLSDLSDKLSGGLPCYAECGGLMYLTNGIYNDGNYYKLAGFFDCSSRMTDRLNRFGYVEVEYDGSIVRAHEFHYSELCMINESDFVYKYTVRRKNKVWMCGLSKKNVLAGYAHVHFRADEIFYKKIVKLLTGEEGL